MELQNEQTTFNALESASARTLDTLAESEIHCPHTGEETAALAGMGDLDAINPMEESVSAGNQPQAQASGPLTLPAEEPPVEPTPDACVSTNGEEQFEASDVRDDGTVVQHHLDFPAPDDGYDATGFAPASSAATDFLSPGDDASSPRGPGLQGGKPSRTAGNVASNAGAASAPEESGGLSLSPRALRFAAPVERQPEDAQHPLVSPGREAEGGKIDDAGEHASRDQPREYEPPREAVAQAGRDEEGGEDGAHSAATRVAAPSSAGSRAEPDGADVPECQVRRVGRDARMRERVPIDTFPTHKIFLRVGTHSKSE